MNLVLTGNKFQLFLIDGFRLNNQKIAGVSVNHTS